MDKAAPTTTSRTFGGAKPPADVRLAATSKARGRPSAAATLSWAAVPDWRLQRRVRFDASRGLQREIRGGGARRVDVASKPRRDRASVASSSRPKTSQPTTTRRATDGAKQPGGARLATTSGTRRGGTRRTQRAGRSWVRRGREAVGRPAEHLAADDNEARDRRGEATRRRAPGDDFENTVTARGRADRRGLACVGASSSWPTEVAAATTSPSRWSDEPRRPERARSRSSRVRSGGSSRHGPAKTTPREQPRRFARDHALRNAPDKTGGPTYWRSAANARPSAAREGGRQLQRPVGPRCC